MKRYRALRLRRFSAFCSTFSPARPPSTRLFRFAPATMPRMFRPMQVGVKANVGPGTLPQTLFIGSAVYVRGLNRVSSQLSVPRGGSGCLSYICMRDADANHPTFVSVADMSGRHATSTPVPTTWLRSFSSLAYDKGDGLRCSPTLTNVHPSVFNRLVFSSPKLRLSFLFFTTA